MGIVVLAGGAIFEKVLKNLEKYYFSKICMSIFPGTGSQNEFFPKRPLAAFSNGELEGRSPSKMQGRSGGRSRPKDDILIYIYIY